MKVHIQLKELYKYLKHPTGTGYNFPEVLKVEAELVEEKDCKKNQHGNCCYCGKNMTPQKLEKCTDTCNLSMNNKCETHGYDGIEENSQKPEGEIGLLENLIQEPSDLKHLTTEVIGEHIFHLTRKLNQHTKAINKLFKSTLNS